MEKNFLACDKAYLATMKNELFGFANKNFSQMLSHLKQQCLALTAHEKKVKTKGVNIP